MLPVPRSRAALPVAALVLALGLAGCSTPDADGEADGDGDAGVPTGAPTDAGPPAGDPTEVHATEVPALHPSVDGYPRGQVDVVTARATHRLAVLVADTPERRQHGLMEVPELPDGVGMLFVGYDSDRTSGFWMKDTLVPLTIAYLAADGTIVDLVHMAPCDADPCPAYPPADPYRSALEVRQGWFADHGITEGAVVQRVPGS